MGFFILPDDERRTSVRQGSFLFPNAPSRLDKYPGNRIKWKKEYAGKEEKHGGEPSRVSRERE